MKHFLPISLAFFLAACVTKPVDKQANHQLELWKEAQANFLAMKAAEHPNRPAPTPPPQQQQLAVQHPPKAPARVQPSPTPGKRLFSFASPQQPAPQQQPKPQKPQRTAQVTSKPQRVAQATPKPQRVAQATPKPQPKVAAQPKPAPKPGQRIARTQGDTVYYWQVPPPPNANTARFQVAEAKYARTLAKRPENLTPEERTWAHEHY